MGNLFRLRRHYRLAVKLLIFRAEIVDPRDQREPPKPDAYVNALISLTSQGR